MPKRIDNEEDMRKLHDLIYRDEQLNLSELSNRSKIEITEDSDDTGVTSRNKSKRRKKVKVTSELSKMNCGCQLLLGYYSGCLAYTFFLVVAPSINIIVEAQTTQHMILADIVLSSIPLLFLAGLADSQSHGG